MTDMLLRVAGCLLAVDAIILGETVPTVPSAQNHQRVISVQSTGSFSSNGPSLLQASMRSRKKAAAANAEDVEELYKELLAENLNKEAKAYENEAQLEHDIHEKEAELAQLQHDKHSVHHAARSQPTMRGSQDSRHLAKKPVSKPRLNQRSIMEIASESASAPGKLQNQKSRPAYSLDTEEGTRDRMVYAYPHTTPPAKPPSDRYFLYDTDEGGLNNIRIGWEMAGVLAQHTNRTLVLPPTQPYYLLSDEGKSTVGSYADLDRLKSQLPTLTFQEFFERERKNLNLPASLAQSDDGTHVKAWKEWARGNLPKITGGDPCDISRYEKHQDKILYAAQTGDSDRLFLCGDWAAIGQPRFTEKGGGSQLYKTAPDNWSLLRNGFTWHPDAFRFTSKVVHKLGLFNYVALHARYNDFQFKEKRQPVEKLIESMGIEPKKLSAASLLQTESAAQLASSRAKKALFSLTPFLKNGTSLYISTDEKDPSFIKAFTDAGVNVVHWDNVAPLLKDAGSPARLEQLKGIVEQMTCAYSRVFVATELSTFSNYAQRMRIYADAPVKERLYHTVARTPEQDKRIEEELKAWDARGGAGSFKPDDPTLVSLAFIPPSR